MINLYNMSPPPRARCPWLGPERGAVLREAIRLRTATVALAESVVGFICHWELDPGIRFELAA